MEFCLVLSLWLMLEFYLVLSILVKVSSWSWQFLLRFYGVLFGPATFCKSYMQFCLVLSLLGFGGVLFGHVAFG